MVLALLSAASSCHGGGRPPDGRCSRKRPRRRGCPSPRVQAVGGCPCPSEVTTAAGAARGELGAGSPAGIGVPPSTTTGPHPPRTHGPRGDGHGRADPGRPGRRPSGSARGPGSGLGDRREQGRAPSSTLTPSPSGAGCPQAARGLRRLLLSVGPAGAARPPPAHPALTLDIHAGPAIAALLSPRPRCATARPAPGHAPRGSPAQEGSERRSRAVGTRAACAGQSPGVSGGDVCSRDPEAARAVGSAPSASFIRRGRWFPRLPDAGRL